MLFKMLKLEVSSEAVYSHIIYKNESTNNSLQIEATND